jgi:hypothetical protein
MVLGRCLVLVGDLATDSDGARQSYFGALAFASDLAQADVLTNVLSAIVTSPVCRADCLVDMSTKLSAIEDRLPTVTVGVRLATLAFAGDIQRESLSATERYPGSSLLPRHAIAAWHLFREQPLLARLQLATTKLAVDQRARLDAEIREDLRRRHDHLLDTAVGKWGAAMNDVDDVAREFEAIQAGIAVEQFHIKTGTYPDTEDALPLHLRDRGLKYERSNDDGYMITKVAGPRPGVVVVEHPPTR